MHISCCKRYSVLQLIIRKSSINSSILHSRIRCFDPSGVTVRIHTSSLMLALYSFWRKWFLVITDLCLTSSWCLASVCQRYSIESYWLLFWYIVYSNIDLIFFCPFKCYHCFCLHGIFFILKYFLQTKCLYKHYKCRVKTHTTGALLAWSYRDLISSSWLTIKKLVVMNKASIHIVIHFTVWSHMVLMLKTFCSYKPTF